MPESQVTTDSLWEMWNAEMQPRTEEIDPSETYCWESLLYGWALAKGANIETASTFAIEFYS